MDPADENRAVSPLDDLVSALRSRVTELQDLVVARGMTPEATKPDLANVDASLKALEWQVGAIQTRLKEELDAIPRAKKRIERSMKKQETKLQHMLANLPSGMRQDLANLPSEMRQDDFATPLVQSSSRMSSKFYLDSTVPQVTEHDLKVKEESTAAPKITFLESTAAPKKGREHAPRLFISAEEFDSLSTYMRGRLTMEKVNIAINEIATYADSNAHLVSCPKNKLSEDTWEKAFELRDIAAHKEVKGKHFFLETDIKGPGLKLDHSGKAILTILRHLGRLHEARIRHHRVFILSK